MGKLYQECYSSFGGLPALQPAQYLVHRHVAEHCSHKYLLRRTSCSKGFITEAEVRSWLYFWVVILEQPSGTYHPSLSGVAKEDSKGKQKALISRKNIVS